MLFLTCLLNSVCPFVTKRRSQWLSFSRKFFTDIFVRVCFSNFLISGLRFFEEYNACYHFIHQQCFLLVTKDGHNLYVGVGSFVEINFAVCSGHFHHFWFAKLWSVWCFFPLFFIVSIVCWSPKMVTMIIFQSKVFYWHLCESLL